jgi:hypothetical protein
MNTETLDWAEWAAMLSAPAELVVAPRQSFNHAEERQRLINLGYPGLAEHFFNPDRAGTDCACYYCRFATVTTPDEEIKPLPTGAPPTSELSANQSLSTAAPPTSELSANQSLSTAAPPTSELSADVLARIERNKKAAQDRLKSLSTAAPPTSELSANQSLSTAAPPTSELSADVLARIERNRKAAQDRLKAKNRLNGPIVTTVLQPLTPEEIRKAELKRKSQQAASFLGHRDKKSKNALLPPPLTPVVTVDDIENEVPMSTQQIQHHFKVLGKGILLGRIIKQEPI